MTTLRNNRKFAALNTEHPRSNLAQNSNVTRLQEDYIFQASEEIEGIVSKNLSQESSRTENCKLGALARRGDFFLNPLVQGYSRAASEMSGNASGKNQGTNEDNSQSDPHSEAGIFLKQTTRNSRPEDGHDKMSAAAHLWKLRSSKSNTKGTFPSFQKN